MGKCVSFKSKLFVSEPFTKVWNGIQLSFFKLILPPANQVSLLALR